MRVKCFQDRGWHEGIKKQLYIEDDDDCRRGPAKHFNPNRIDELAHFGFFAGEAHQRPDGKTELHGQHDLAGNEQLRGLAFAETSDDAHSRNDGQRAGYEPAQPGRKRRLMKPSMTICPASVPVSVEFCPEASSATAKRMLATPTPIIGLNSLYAS